MPGEHIGFIRTRYPYNVEIFSRDRKSKSIVTGIKRPRFLSRSNSKALQSLKGNFKYAFGG